MRTVDPELWYMKVKKPRIQVTRTMRFGMTNPTGFEYLVRASFVDAMREFLTNCSIRAIVRIRETNEPCQRYTYRIMLASLLCVGLSVVIHNSYQLSKMPPLLINQLANKRSVQYINFPAVGLCNNNVFSSKALHKYTAYLSARGNNSTYSEEDIRENLLKFGAMVNLVGQHIDVMFINFLSRVHPDFNITELMFKLSPKCSSILRRCSWRGRLMPCDRLFSTRITSLGFCCVFNSRYQPEDVNTPPKILDITGQDFGLSFVIQNSEDEFVYRRRPSIGYEVMMFEGSEYPLVEGGGVRLFPVQPNTSLFLTLRARAERHTSSLLLYNEKRRGCRVRDWWGPRSWRSSYAWCLTACRRRTVAALCACRPYTLPPGDTFVPQCTLNHLPCLNKHKEKFMYYYPGEESDPSLSEERQDAQECQRCSPDCARVAYSAAAAYKHYRAGETIFQNYVSKGIGLVNASIVRVFYTSEHQQQYSVEANQRWYEVTAFLASQWVAVMSVTVVFISEVLFYCTLRWAHHYRRRARAAREIIIHKLC